MQNQNQNIMELCNPKHVKNWVELLAGQIGPRPWNNPGKLRRVASIIRQYLLDLGYEVDLQQFFYKKNEYFNVIACSRGRKPLARTPSPIVVVGAHYDTVASSPGADDNASAVAGLLEIARIFSQDPPSALRMAWFCLEEPPAYRSRNMGSYHYAKLLKESDQTLKGMICLEMIGYFSDRPGSQKFPFPFMDRIYPSTGNFIALVGNTRSRNFTMDVKRHFERGSILPVESLNAPCIVVGIDFSDHWSFYKMGYKATMVTDTAFYRNPNYHRPSDLPSSLDYNRAALVVDGLVEAISGLTAPLEARGA